MFQSTIKETDELGATELWLSQPQRSKVSYIVGKGGEETGIFAAARGNMDDGTFTADRTARTI